MVTGASYPVVVMIGLMAWAVFRWIDPPELPPGTITMTSETTIEGWLAGAGYVGLLTMIACSVGSVVGAAVGLVVGAVCALVDALTGRRLDPTVVALVGVGAYLSTVLGSLSVGWRDLLTALLVTGPGVLGALTLKAVPIRM